MLNLEEIARSYPESLQSHKAHMLREYLQYKILAIISHSRLAPKLSFLGGTALRLIYNNSRFSEDLDFDNFGLTRTEFEAVSLEVQRGLEADGMLVEISFAGHEAFRCNVRFPGLLYKSGISALAEQKILLQIDTLAHGVFYEPDIKQLNKFDVFTDLRTTPLDILLSQKLFACVNRPRPKGRDFFDMVFLFSLRVIPNYDYLKEKTGVVNENELRAYILERTKSYDFVSLAEDVRPFLFKSDDAIRVERFVEIFTEAKLV